ncbi:GATA-type zinc finger protein 1, partial [Varanus komodoensis]
MGFSLSDRVESFSSMACCLQIPDSKALNFLQETAQQPSQPEPISSNSGRPPQQAGLAVQPRRSATTPQGDGLSPALASIGALDALSLINLHCSSLESEPGDRTELQEAAQEKPPVSFSKGHCSNHPWTPCLEEPRAVERLGTGVAYKFESQRAKRRISRKQSRPMRSYERDDPAFQGVTFQMHLCLNQISSQGCQLLIKAQYSRVESFSSMACCLQIPDSKALNFLQETAQQPSQPEPISSNSGRPPQQAGLAVQPRRSAMTPQGDGLSPALASIGALDALSLINLHCSSL